MTIPISRGRLGVVLLLPIVALRIGIELTGDPGSQQTLGIEWAEPIALVIGWVLLAAGVAGVLQLGWQLVNPGEGLSWDADEVRVRVGLGPVRAAKREEIESIRIARWWPSVALVVGDRRNVMIPVWLLDLPAGWTVETVADQLQS